ncbi:MAG TPA: hypothetical protein VER75_07940 [Thermoleophilaceae bacterium]|nr:hypothetical protein [Thermoleophilaceae bacterium]
MSRRKRSPTGGARQSAIDGEREREPRAPRLALATQLAILIAIFAVATVTAELAGAANVGVAVGVGQVAFAIGLVTLMMRA